MHLGIGLLSIVVQIYFAIHAGKSGRYWWIFPIFVFPLFGSIVYFFVEYLPELKLAAQAKRSRNKTPRHNIKELERALELTDSVKNRITLAEAYFHAGRYQDSIDLLENTLTGMHSDDPYILEGLAYACFHNGDFVKAREYLEKLETSQDGKLPVKARLLRAKSLEQLSEFDAAVDDYRSVMNILSGEEPRCRCALLLKKLGRNDEAQELFNQMVKHAEVSPKHYRKAEKRWIAIAKTETQ